MTPQIQTKTSKLSDDLWIIFTEGKNLNIFNRNRFGHEIDSLKKADPDGFLILSALLAAIEGNDKDALDLADIALKQCNHSSMLLNWSNMLVNLGQIRKAFLFAEKSWNLAPGDPKTNDSLLLLAAVMEVAETLEAAAETWHRLNPGQTHPLAAAYQLNQKDTPLFTLDDERILKIFSALQEKSCEVNPPASRLEALANSLIQELDK